MNGAQVKKAIVLWALMQRILLVSGGTLCTSLIPILLTALLFPAASFASEQEKLPVPRFVSIKSQEVNARTGPGARYPIRWTFVKKGEPVEIITEYELWRQIRDVHGDEGWVHKSMLSGKRSAIITGTLNQFIHDKPDEAAVKIAEIEPQVRTDLLACKKDWCKIQAHNGYNRAITGWIKRTFLWGLYPAEDSL
jgi:SH3-like domain-containing protein